MAKTYAEKLRDPRWQKKRLEILQCAGWACEDCNAKDRELQVHHCAYISGLEPWEHPNETLMSVCDDCHQRRQKFEDAIKVSIAKVLRFMNPEELEKEAWEIISQMSVRQTERMASAFTP